MLFAHLKRYIGVPMMRLRGPKGANEQSQLAATAQDLRKLAKLVPDPAAKSASLPFSITFNNSREFYYRSFEPCEAKLWNEPVTTNAAQCLNAFYPSQRRHYAFVLTDISPFHTMAKFE